MLYPCFQCYEETMLKESAESLTSTPLPDDHSGYTIHDYAGQEVEVESTAMTLGEMLGLGLSRVENAICAEPTVKDESWGWGRCSVRLAGREQGWLSLSCECQLLVHPTDLSSCEVSGSLTDWRPVMEVTMADSTNDLYQLQVSPLASSSEGGYFFFPSPVFYWSAGGKTAG